MADRYFDLTIRLINAEMQTDGAIAAALREVADHLEDTATEVSDPMITTRSIRDLNGHRVGWWNIGNSRRSAEKYR